MSTRLLSLLVWAAVAASGVYWGLQLFTRPTPVPGGASLAAAPAPGAGHLARLLGEPPAQPVQGDSALPVDSRFRLVGVVASRGVAASGLALISVDGKPARAVAVGRELEPGLRLLTVNHRQAELGATRGAPAMTLALPPLMEAQRGRPGEAAAPSPQAGLPANPQAGWPGFSRPGLPAGMQGMPPPSARPPSGVPPQTSVPGLPNQPIAPVTPQGDSHGTGDSTESSDGAATFKNAPGLQTR